jgi:VanZ family protein
MVLLWTPPTDIVVQDSLLPPGADKLIHLFLFATLYVLCAKAHREQNLTISRATVLIGVIVFALLTEVTQLYISERSFEILDMIANTVGAIGAYVIMNRILN